MRKRFDISITACRQLTNHARKAGTAFCACGHAMYDDGEKRERCNSPRHGGGRTCYLPKGHKGGHVFECGR